MFTNRQSFLRPALIALAAGAPLLALAHSLFAQPIPANPTATDPNRHAVTNPHIARTLFNHADTRRVDFAIIGDSNVRNAIVSGHEDGMSRALSARFGCYATRVDPYAGTNSWAAAVAGGASFAYAPFQIANAPREAAAWSFPTQAFPAGYGYLSAAHALPVHYNGGLAVLPDHPIDIERALRYHLTMYRWRTPTTGSLALTVRGPAFTNFAAAVFRTSDAAPGPGDLVNNRGTRGPFFGQWHRVEAPGQLTGISYSPLLYQGGRSARAACIELNNLGPQSRPLREWMRQTTRLQAAAPMLCIQILHGGNDFGDYAFSVGPVGGLYSDTPEGHADNMRGIIDNLRAEWLGLAFDPANLFFILGPYHPRGDRIEREAEYEQQWVAIAGEYPNTIVIRGTQLSTEQEFIQRGWMRDETDFAHLSIEGYRAWGMTTVEVLQRAACPADCNHDRVISTQDLYTFLEDYFQSDPHADFTANGGPPTIDDLFAFLAAWFQGC